MERFGFVGLPNAGKSSLYNALTGGGALAAPYAFATKDPNVGVAKVPDERLDALAEMSKSKNVVPATRAVRRHRRAGRGGVSKGEGLGNRSSPHPRGRRDRVRAAGLRRRRRARPVDPLEHLASSRLELALADLETVEKPDRASGARPPGPTSRWPTRWRARGGQGARARARRSTAPG
jgi:ribosome-binding ATPase